MAAYIILTTASAGLTKTAKKIFIIHSYEKDHICGQPQHDGAVKALADTGWLEGKNLEISAYYMDTKRTNNTPELIARQAQLAGKAIADFRPDVVLTLDDNAFRTIALPAAGTSTPYVFSGMNGQPEKYNMSVPFMQSRNLPNGNITGVYEKLYIREAVKVVSNLLDVEKVLFLSDQSPTGLAIKKQVELELDAGVEDGQLPVKTNQKTIKSWEEFVQTLASVNDDPHIGAFYLGTLLLKDRNGRTYTAPDIIDYTIQHAKKPAIGLNYAFIKLGLFGGATVDFFSMGELAGRKIAKILAGAEAGSIAIEDAPRVALVFNVKRIEALGLKVPSDILLAADEVFRK